MTIFVKIPIKTISEANTKEFWKKAATRHKRQKFAVKAYLNAKLESLRIPCRIKITRIAPNKLDYHDNLPMSVKWIVDQICEMIKPDCKAGRADDTGFKIEYDQRSGEVREYAVEIEITNLYEEIPGEEKCTQ